MWKKSRVSGDVLIRDLCLGEREWEGNGVERNGRGAKQKGTGTGTRTKNGNEER